MEIEQAKEKLRNYRPCLLILGVRKSGELESVIVHDKVTFFVELDKFIETRVFFLKENFKIIEP